MEQFDNTVSIRLQQFIKAMNWNKAEFARTAGISPQNVNRYLNGNISIGQSVLQNLALSGLNVNWLLVGVGKMLLKDSKETTIDFILRPSSELLPNMDINDINNYLYGGDVDPVEKLDFPALLSEGCLLGYVFGNSMQSYGIQMDDTVVINALADGETNEDSLVIIHTTNYHSNQFTLRYYDKKSNKLLAGSKDLAPIPYSPELIVPARITSIIRPL